jgi:hypothetical protein
LAGLKAAFIALYKEDLRDLKICLIVDGLDEFTRVPQDLVTLLLHNLLI